MSVEKLRVRRVAPVACWIACATLCVAAFGTAVQADVLPWNLLLRGFNYDGRRVPLVSM